MNKKYYYSILTNEIKEWLTKGVRSSIIEENMVTFDLDYLEPNECIVDCGFIINNENIAEFIKNIKESK